MNAVKQLTQARNDNKTVNGNGKKLNSLKRVFNGNMAYITHLIQQKSKRFYYLGARGHYGDVLQK